MAKNNGNGHEEEFSSDEFTPFERKRLRRIMEADTRARWFWTTSRTWVLWIGGVAVAISATFGWVKDVVKSLVR